MGHVSKTADAVMIQIYSVGLHYFFQDQIQQQLMIKGKKIESQSINVIVNTKSSTNTNTSNASLSLQSIPQAQKLKHESECMPQADSHEQSQAENKQIVFNKIKEKKSLSKQKKENTKLNSDMNKEKKQTSRVALEKDKQAKKMSSIHDRNIPPQVQKDRNDQISKVKSKSNLKSSKEVVKQTELPKNIDKRSLRFQNAPTPTQKQDYQQTQQDDMLQVERLSLPNPIEVVPMQQAAVSLKQEHEKLLIDNESDSLSDEQGFSYQPKSDPQSTDNMLPINMQLFQLSADELLALDYFAI